MIIHWLIVFTLIFGSVGRAAEDPTFDLPPPTYTDDEKVMLVLLEKACTDERFLRVKSTRNGLTDHLEFYVKVSGNNEPDRNRGRNFDCGFFGVGPLDLHLDANRPSDLSDVTRTPELLKILNDHYCKGVPQKFWISRLECSKSVGCNVLRTLISIGTLGMWVIGPGVASKIRRNMELSNPAALESIPSGSASPVPSSVPSPMPSYSQPPAAKPPGCLSKRHSDCMTEVYSSVLRAIWQDVTSTWFAAKNIIRFPHFVYRVLKSWITGFFEKKIAQELESAMTEKTHLAALTAPAVIDQFQDKPETVMISYAEIQERFLTNLVRNFVTCGRWSDEPYFSTCQKPARSWGCTTCSDKVNTFCNNITQIIGVNRFVADQAFRQAMKIVLYINAPLNIKSMNQQLTKLLFDPADPTTQRYVYLPIDLFDQLIVKLPL